MLSAAGGRCAGLVSKNNTIYFTVQVILYNPGINTIFAMHVVMIENIPGRCKGLHGPGCFLLGNHFPDAVPQ